ncbi:hypothetical protein CASFOL_001329 [Castilleja foliolosa]|uniref:Uncharacterized protein n=1 Tax=Castilleja foliolosa TaxID=1961234 RepID=A0ABD3EMA2_9LAMI
MQFFSLLRFLEEEQTDISQSLRSRPRWKSAVEVPKKKVSKTSVPVSDPLDPLPPVERRRYLNLADLTEDYPHTGN